MFRLPGKSRHYRPRALLQLEALEGREVPAVLRIAAPSGLGDELVFQSTSPERVAIGTMDHTEVPKQTLINYSDSDPVPTLLSGSPLVRQDLGAGRTLTALNFPADVHGGSQGFVAELVANGTLSDSNGQDFGSPMQLQIVPGSSAEKIGDPVDVKLMGSVGVAGIPPSQGTAEFQYHMGFIYQGKRTDMMGATVDPLAHPSNQPYKASATGTFHAHIGDTFSLILFDRLETSPGAAVGSLETAGEVAGDLLAQLVLTDTARPALAISNLHLSDIDHSPLQYLSVSPQNIYFNGNTRVDGTLTLTGQKGDRLQSLKLQIVQGGTVVATANLAATAQNLLRPFDAAGTIQVKANQLLFELPNSEAAKIDVSRNGTVVLRVVATTQGGGVATQDSGPVTLLTRYTAANRYGSRDPAVGGDDWILPSIKPVLEHFTGLSWGDMSNMNGGSFDPHAAHQQGIDADGWFPGYNQRNAATAHTLIALLNDPTYGSRIIKVGVTYQAVNGNPFWDAIKNVILKDGRRARDVILNWAGHTTHFHWQITP